MEFRSVICGGLGILAVSFLLFSTPAQTFSPHGIILPAKHTRSPIAPNQVVVYQQEPTITYQALGEVRVEQGFHVPDAASRDRLIQHVKEMAASIGANAVIMKVFVPDDGLRKVFTFIGTAIYIPNQSKQQSEGAL